MRYSRFVSCMVFAAMVLSAGAIGATDDFPVLRDVQVASSVTHDAGAGLFRYSYVVRNLAGNTGDVALVEVDISAAAGSAVLSADGLMVERGTNADGQMHSRSFMDEYARKASLMKTDVVPVGMQTPDGWMGGVSVRGTSQWGSRLAGGNIAPGQSLGGFGVASRGLPSIREVAVHPDWVLMVDHAVTEKELEKLQYTRDRLAYRTKVVGPAASPEAGDPLGFVDSLIGMTNDAYALGWITNQGVMHSLEAKLKAARTKLLSGNFVPARNILNALVHELDAQGCQTHDECTKGKHIKPEAYALLKYNADYLAETLR